MTSSVDEWIDEVARTTHPKQVVWCDGSRSVDLREGMEIEIGRGQHRLRLARLSQSPFTNRLVNKFQLPVDGWRGSAERERRRRLADGASEGEPSLSRP